MENSKLCPNCGKPVPAGKAYCMSCGVSLGIKCPECGVVLPLGSKICTGCGHSFEVRKIGQKKKKKKNPEKTLGFKIKKYSGGIFTVLCGILAILTLVFFFVSSITMSAPLEKGGESRRTEISGADFTENFFGSENSSVERLKNATDRLGGDTARIDVLGDIIAVSYVMTLVFAAVMLIFALGNIGRQTKPVAKKLTVYLILISAFSAIQFAAGKVITGYVGALAAHAQVSEFYSFGGTSLAWLIVCLATAVLTGAFVLGIFAKRPADGTERTLTGMLFRNGFIKGIGAFFGRRFNKNGKSQEGSLTVTRVFPWYLGLLAASLIFTQALDNVASFVLFVFLLAAPIILLIYTLIAKAALTVTMESDASTIEKNQPYTYKFKIHNRSIFMYPFIDAVISLPQANSVRCSERTVRLSMPPLSVYDFNNTVQFKFRGTYSIGVKCFYVYDFFRLFKVRVDIENITDIYVLPRRLNIDEDASIAVADSTKRTVKSPITYDKLEVSDVREYRLGDPLKSIHWNLSSKSEEFIVREYNTGTSNMTFVYCDLSARFPEEPPIRVTAEAVKEKTPEKPKKQKAEKPAKPEKAKKTGKKPAKAKEIPEDAPIIIENTDVQELEFPIYYEDMNEFLADGVVELAVAAVLRELRAGRPVTLLWFDRRSEAGVYAETLFHVDDFEVIYKQFATAPLCGVDKTVGRLTAIAGETDNSRQVFVTGAADGASISDLCAVTGAGDNSGYGAAEVILYNPNKRFAHPVQRELYLSGCRAQLAASGLALRVETLSNVSEAPKGGSI